MNTLHIIASAEANNFITMSGISCLIAGLLFFLFGLLIGWLIWRHYSVQSMRLEKENARLVELCDRRQKALADHELSIKSFTASNN